ncbi:MAG: Fic family protein [Candidatus Limnocylindrales bacterium]
MTWVERRWGGDPGAVGGSRARQGFSYRAFVPSPIARIDPTVSFATARAIDDAEMLVGRLNADERVRGLDAIGPLLLRSEAIASSRIEGIELSQRNLARALIDPRAAKGSAKAVAANVVAMEEAVAVGGRGSALTTEDLLGIHRILMTDASPRIRPGSFRQEQNWLGGRFSNPSDATYVPPPEDEVEALMLDLVYFVNRDDLPAIAQAAIAHAQFETIHPFVDGNGRVGRALIHVILRRRGLALAFVPPISVVLAARPGRYVDGLVAFREGRLGAWYDVFAEACARAASQSIDLAARIEALETTWFERAGRPRRDSAAARIIKVIPAQPIMSAATIRAAIDARHQRALEGLKHLAASGVVRQISRGDYDKQYAADELFDLIEDFEQRVATARNW